MRGGGEPVLLRAVLLLCVCVCVDVPFSGASEIVPLKRHFVPSDHPLAMGLRRELLGNDVPSYRRVVTAADGRTDTLPLTGDFPAALFSAIFEIGSAKQRFSLLLDTGSNGMAVVGTGCLTDAKSCPSANPPFDPKASTSVSPLSCSVGLDCAQPCVSPYVCDFSLKYLDGSAAQGSVVQDVVQLGSLATVASFGVITSESPRTGSNVVLSTGNDGIVGLSRNTSTTALPPVLMYLLPANQKPVEFGLCLGYTEGALTVGGMNASLQTGTMDWVPLKGSSEFYQVGVRGFRVGPHDMKNPNSIHAMDTFTIVDSGTTAIVLPNSVFEDFQSAIRDYCSTFHMPGVCGEKAELLHNRCIDLSKSDREGFPDLYFTLGDRAHSVELRVPSQYYLIPQGGLWCLGVTGLETTQLITILGDAFMRAFYVGFNQTAVGFAPQNCPQGVVPSDSWHLLRYFLIIVVLLAICFLLVGIYFWACTRAHPVFVNNNDPQQFPVFYQVNPHVAAEFSTNYVAMAEVEGNDKPINSRTTELTTQV